MLLLAALALSLAGIWRADTTLGPTVHGALRISQTPAGAWQAQIAGRHVPVYLTGDTLTAALPDSQGAFRGHFAAHRTTIVGCWIQPRSPLSGVAYATPVTLRRQSPLAWSGPIAPLDEHYTLYLDIQPNGTAIVRVPERNYFPSLSWAHYTVITAGDSLRLVDSANADVRIMAHYDQSRGTLTITWPATDALPLQLTMSRDSTGWRPRAAPYRYRVPTADADGWTTSPAGLEGIDESALTALVQRIASVDPAQDNPPLIQSVLIARHGHLVLDEYFYGFHANRLHDLRSASKTFTSVMLGAAMDHGAPVTPDTPISPLLTTDAQKAGITVANLLTHSTGLACDDNDEASPGQEDRMYSQSAQPDWYRFILDLPVAHPPGQTYAYCSGGMNLVGDVIHTTTHQWLPEFFAEHVAQPLEIHTWAMNLMPNGDGYMGGGLYLRPRDLLKLGAAYLNGGTWRGTRLVSSAWVQTSTASHITSPPETDDGYAWHRFVLHTPDGHSYQDYEATGNGGQLLIVVPAKDLAVVFTAANYQRYRVWRTFRQDLVANLILPAVKPD